MRRRVLRWSLIACGLAFVAWVGWGIQHAGIDVPPLPVAQPVTLTHGLASGRRMKGPSWSFDYQTVQTSPDGSFADIDDVRHGILYRAGKPFLGVTATHVSVNTVTNDFTATGAIHIWSLDPAHRRTLDTDHAVWTNASEKLLLDHPVTLDDDGASVVVKTVSINFRTGVSRAGPVQGSFNVREP